MIRKASMTDLKRIDDIAVKTIEDMAISQIPQWDMSYPRARHYESDIKAGDLYLYLEDKEILGAMTLKREQDPPYETITGWRTPHGESYVIHRVIVDPSVRRRGVFHQLLNYAITVTTNAGFHSIKIDTHNKNYKMRQFLESHGFEYIGYLDCIDREAYELVWEESV